MPLACSGDAGGVASSFGSTATDSGSASASATASGTAGSASGTAGTDSDTATTGMSGSATSGSGSDTDSAGTSATTSAGATSGTSAGTTTGTSAGTTAGTGGGSTSGASGTTGGVTAGSTSGVTGGSTGGASGTTGGVANCDCTPGLDDGIFVLSDTAQIYKYVPDLVTPNNPGVFGLVGNLNCGGMTNAFSMAVDRLGFAWVMFQGAGDIWKADLTNNGACSDPGYAPGQSGANLYGMAFVSNSIADQCDNLYGNTYDGIGGFSEGANVGDFHVVDPNTLVLSPISTTNYNGAELTGTGDGRTFLFAGIPAKVIELNKANGNVVQTWALGGLALTNAFAFAHFGGDFYFFTESANPNVSRVSWWDFDDSDGGFANGPVNINNAAPVRIVGAGVSTCAPYEPQ